MQGSESCGKRRGIRATMKAKPEKQPSLRLAGHEGRRCSVAFTERQNMREHFENEPKFRLWKETVERSGCTIKRITPLNLIYTRHDELLFALLETEIHAPDGYKLPGIALVRGNACVAVVLLRNRASGEERFLMIRQWRTGSGTYALEFPAGMIDRNIDTPAEVAAKEIHEETGLEIAADSLVSLAGKPLYTSAGLIDEAILYYGCVVELDPGEYEAFEGRKAGSPHEGESISVTLRTRMQAESETTSAQVLLGFYLFEKAFGTQTA
jgi:ADP-sugar diphosphatase